MSMQSLNCRAMCLLIMSGFLHSLSYADEVALESFQSGTTISSASVNNNFSKLANQTNQNTNDVSSLTSRIDSVDGVLTPRVIKWLGYTSQPFDAPSEYAGTHNGILMSMHCKAEFGADAYVASDLDIVALIKSGDSFQLPIEISFILWQGEMFNEGAGPFRTNTMFRQYRKATDVMTIDSYGYAQQSNNSAIHPVACVALR